jgi:hypothetical protein
MSKIFVFLPVTNESRAKNRQKSPMSKVSCIENAQNLYMTDSTCKENSTFLYTSTIENIKTSSYAAFIIHSSSFIIQENGNTQF